MRWGERGEERREMVEAGKEERGERGRERGNEIRGTSLDPLTELIPFTGLRNEIAERGLRRENGLDISRVVILLVRLHSHVLFHYLWRGERREGRGERRKKKGERRERVERRVAREGVVVCMGEIWSY